MRDGLLKRRLLRDDVSPQEFVVCMAMDAFRACLGDKPRTFTLDEIRDWMKTVAPNAPIADQGNSMGERLNEDPWLSGEPYYCVLCGAGGGEFMACEMPDCKLESKAAAQKRRRAALASHPGTVELEGKKP